MPVVGSNNGSPAVIDIPIGLPSKASAVPTNPGMRTIELSTGRVREGFGKHMKQLHMVDNKKKHETILANGDIIVTLLPVNTKWPWITPAVFRPELVPEELMAQGLTVSTFLQTF